MLRQLLSPLWTALIAGAVHGLNLVAIYSLTRALLGNAANAACLAASVVLAAFGPLTLSEVGTSFADIALSLPIIAALILMASSDEPRPGFNILAGVLIGASVALKLTNVVFAFGLVAAAIAAIRPLGALGCIALGGAISDPHRLSSLPRLFAMRGQRNVPPLGLRSARLDDHSCGPERQRSQRHETRNSTAGLAVSRPLSRTRSSKAFPARRFRAFLACRSKPSAAAPID